MTINPRENFPNVSQQKKSMILDEKNEKLNEAAEQELLQMPAMQQELWKKPWHAGRLQQCAAIQANSDQHNQERQLDEGQVNEEKTLDEGIDNLLILANSAALMLESEYYSAGAHKNDQNIGGTHNTPIAQNLQEKVNDSTAKDQKSPESKLNGMPVSAHERSEKDGSCCKGKGPRLTQIRRLARLKNHSLVQQSIGEYTCEHLQEKTTHLTQIQQQAWSRNHELLEERVGECASENLQGRRMRLTQIKRLARSKVMQDGIEKHKHRHLDCHTYEENRTERVATEQCENMDRCQVVKGWSEQSENSSNQSCLFGPLRQENNGRLETTCQQFDGVTNYTGELQERQRIARQLRAMRTTKLRGQLGKQHIGTSLKGSKWRKELREKHIAAGQGQWNAMANQPSGQIYETHLQQLGNIPNVQNKETIHHFQSAPNKIFQQCEAEPGWLSLMSYMQQNEQCRLAGLQKGVQHIEGKRETKNLHQHLNSHVPNEESCELDNSSLKTDHAVQQPANSSCHKVDVKAEDKTMRVKGRVRLTQFKREARCRGTR